MLEVGEEGELGVAAALLCERHVQRGYGYQDLCANDFLEYVLQARSGICMGGFG